MPMGRRQTDQAVRLVMILYRRRVRGVSVGKSGVQNLRSVFGAALENKTLLAQPTRCASWPAPQGQWASSSDVAAHTKGWQTRITDVQRHSKNML
jgi:hypothetical protein